eukprot:6490580-Lingulodinium_polyedra.AAC.1
MEHAIPVQLGCDAVTGTLNCTTTRKTARTPTPPRTPGKAPRLLSSTRVQTRPGLIQRRRIKRI